MKQILIIEDDIALTQGVALALKNNEVDIYIANNLHSAKEKIKTNFFDLILLDINLPDGNGLDFLTELRKTNTTKIIILTANDMETDIVAGLELGADDYITKPFSLAILRARVNTQLRGNIKQKIKIDAFTFNFDKMEFYKNDNLVELSKTEQKLLRLLIENKGVTLSREKLLDSIWTDGADFVDENALSVTIKRLRDKLEDTSSKPQYIKTIYSLGYTWTVK